LHGTLLLAGSGFTYRPGLDFNGLDSFRYVANDGELDSNVATVSLTVIPVNDPPVAVGQTSVMDERTVLHGRLVATDVDSPSLTYRVVDGPGHGILVVDAAGTFTYTPNEHFHGDDSFTFRANDGSLDSNLARVTITVRDVTPPVLSLPPDQVFEATSAAGVVVHYAGAVATDDSPPVTIEYSLANDSLFALGRTTVHVTARDAAGNTATGDFAVVVVDTTPPDLIVPADVAAEATSAAGAQVTFAARASDAVSIPTVTYSQQPGGVFTLGTTTVTVTAKDAAGNTTVKTFRVTVVDTTSPTGSIVLNEGAATTTTGNITVGVSFRDAVGVVRMRFSIDGGSTWTTWEPYAPARALNLSGADGVKTVIAQVADAAGNVGTASASIVLAIPPPAIVVTGIVSGQACDLCSSQLVKVIVTAPIAAGAITVSATLDGRPFALPGTIDPFLLTAGGHTLRIVARDLYGRESVQVVGFSVHATIEGLICAVRRAVVEGLVAPELETSLLAKLNAARASRDRGNPTPEINQLEAFTHELAAQRGKKIDLAFVDRATGWTDDLIARIRSGAAR
jgi:hypothetical protein